jgi:hypothetical protein
MVRITTPKEKDETFIHLSSVRGKVKNYSRKSRRRLFMKLSQVNIHSYSQVFHCANTFHNCYPKDGQGLKKVLSCFLKLLSSFEPSFNYFWKLEFQERGAPHFHFLFFNTSHSIITTQAIVERIVNDCWVKATSDNGFFHRKYGCRTVELNNLEFCFRYFCKYAGKEDNKEWNSYVGRRWGYSKKLDFNPLFSFDVPCPVVGKFRKHFLNYLDNRKKISPEFLYYIETSGCLELLIGHTDLINLFVRSFVEAKFSIPPSLELFRIGVTFL